MITETYRELEDKLLQLETLRDQQIKRKNDLEKEIDNLSNDVVILDKVSSLFKHLLDVLLDEKKQEIQKLVTYGLKSVFTEQNLKFHINIEPKYNTIHTTFKTEQVGITEGDVLESFGGGVVNIESFLLRIITLFQTKLSPFMFMDEVFSHLSEDYVDNCSKLLKNLCDELGITLFLITHKEQMLNHADKVYKARSRAGRFVLEK